MQRIGVASDVTSDVTRDVTRDVTSDGNGDGDTFSDGDRRSRSTVRGSLRWLVALLLLLTLAVSVAALIAVQTSTSKFIELAKGYAPASDATRNALEYMLDAETAVRGYLLTRDRSYLQPYDDNASSILPTIDQSRASLASVGAHELDSVISDERLYASAWLDTIAMPVVASPDPRLPRTVDAAGRALFDRFRTANSTVTQALMAKRTSLRKDTVTTRTDAIAAIVAVALLALAGGSVYGGRTARRVLRPLASLWWTVRRLASGDMSARAPVEGPVEIRAIAQAVNSLGAQVEAAAEAVRVGEAMREQLRPMSELLRVAADPRSIGQALVTGLGSVFGVDRVWLHTIDDARVEPLTVQWHGPEAPAAPPAPTGDRDRLQAIVHTLWHGTGLIAVNDLATVSYPPEISAVVAAAREAGATAAVYAAVGDSTAPVGLLAISYCGVTHEWTPTELSLIARICAELGSSLVQNHTVSQQLAAIARLRELDEAKSALVSTVSHELRTPLTSIKGYLEMVLDGDGGVLPAEAAEMLRVVERNATRLRTMIEDLLTESRIEAGGIGTVATQVDVHDVLGASVATMAPIADANGVRLEVDPPAPAELLVMGDVRQLEQALTNLLANAIKFTPTGGLVRLDARADGDGRAVLRVTDTGIGIPEQDRDHLFERFYRASNAAAAEIPGTGLGLSIVQEIVDAHGGAVRIESTLGEGTAVEIVIPSIPG